MMVRRERELKLEEVKHTWQGGETKRLPFAGRQGDENISSLKEFLNRFGLVARSCGVSKIKAGMLDGIAHKVQRNSFRF